MRQLLYIIIIWCTIMALAGCDGGGRPVKHLENLGDTPYQQDTILVTCVTNPERALVLLDSAVRLGNVNEYREKVIRATIYSRSFEAKRLDEALSICKTLLQHDSVRNDPANHESVLNILIAISRVKNDSNEYLRWSTKKAELCRQQGEEVELLRTEADIGLVMTFLGQVDEGIAKLDEVIRQLE